MLLCDEFWSDKFWSVIMLWEEGTKGIYIDGYGIERMKGSQGWGT